jgi:4-hydroxy-tetrahydrodipicolinate synthase
MLENVRAMADAGAQIAVATAPGYFNYNQQELESIFSKFADASPLPVVIYDIPDLAGMKLDVELLIRLAHHDNVVGFKDSTADYVHFEGLLAGLSGFPDFYLLQGKERYLFDSLIAGASGFVVSMVQIDPRPFVRLSQAVRAGKRALAQRLQNEITKIMDVFEGSFARRPETSTFFHLLNWTLRHQGVCDNILLDHEGDCPGWLADNARKVVEICDVAASITE